MKLNVAFSDGKVVWDDKYSRLKSLFEWGYMLQGGMVVVVHTGRRNPDLRATIERQLDVSVLSGAGLSAAKIKAWTPDGMCVRWTELRNTWFWMDYEHRIILPAYRGVPIVYPAPQAMPYIGTSMLRWFMSYPDSVRIRITRRNPERRAQYKKFLDILRAKGRILPKVEGVYIPHRNAVLAELLTKFPDVAAVSDKTCQALEACSEEYMRYLQRKFLYKSRDNVYCDYLTTRPPYNQGKE